MLKHPLISTKPNIKALKAFNMCKLSANAKPKKPKRRRYIPITENRNIHAPANSFLIALIKEALDGIRTPRLWVFLPASLQFLA